MKKLFQVAKTGAIMMALILAGCDANLDDSGSSSSSGSGSQSVSAGPYQCPTTKAVNDPTWIQSHGSYWAAASAHDNYALCLKTNTAATCQPYLDQETKYCSVAKSLCLAVVTNPSSCPG